MPGVSPPAEPPLSPPLSPPAPQEDFAGAPIYLPDGSAPAAPVICFAKAVREPRRGCDTIVTTSHGPPGAAATTITHRRPEPSQLSQLSQQPHLPSLCALLPPADEPGGGASSPLEELLSLPELRDAVLQWLPCCDLFRARRISRRLLVWADAALAAQRSPAVVGNATRDYYGLELTQQLDPRGLAFATLGPPVPAVRGHRPADDCTQIGSRIFALRGSSLAVAELPELPEPGGTEDSSPASPVLEPVSSPEREPRDSGSQRESTPHKGGVGSLPIGTPTSTRADRSPELVWRDGIFQIPAPGAGLRRSRAPSVDHLRVGGRLCAMRDGGLLLVGGGVDQTVAPPPPDDPPPLDPPPPAADDLDEMLDIGRARAARERAAAARADLAAAAVLRQELQRRTTALGITAQVLRVQPSTGLWQRLPDLLEARRDCIVAALPDGGVLVAGGSDARGAIASAERYDPIAQKWRALPPMAHARTSASAVALPDGRVAVVGGHKPGRKPQSYRFHSSSEIFDPRTESWAALDAVMSLPRATCLVGLIGGARPGSESLVVTGGWSGPFRHTTTEIYDGSAEAWRTLPSGEVQGKSLGGAMVYLQPSSSRRGVSN